MKVQTIVVMIWALGLSGDMIPIFQPSGGYDSNGNVLAYTDTVMGAWSFSYDQLNRLTGATASTAPPGLGTNFCWSYDSFGNRTAQVSASAAESWIEAEVSGSQFADERHGQRLRRLLEQFSGRVGAPTPWACQDWANTKAAYRFFDNDRIDEAQILAGHFAATRERFVAADRMFSRSGQPVGAGEVFVDLPRFKASVHRSDYAYVQREAADFDPVAFGQSTFEMPVQ